MREFIIYCPNDSYHFDFRTVLQVEQTSDLEYFSNSNKVKVFYVTFPVQVVCCFPGTDLQAYFNNEVLPVINASDYTFIDIFEIHEPSEILLRWLNECSNKNITVYLPTFHNIHKFDNLKMVFNPKWITTTTHFIKNLPQSRDIFYQLNPYEVKPKLFDILLGSGGSHKPHRDFIFDMVKISSFKDDVIMNFRNINRTDANSEFFLDEEGVKFIIDDRPFSKDHGHSSFRLEYFGVETPMATIIPFNIYKQTAYSVVAETQSNNVMSFATEKTLKPITARRLFVVFAGKDHLKNLRSLGFKTFDGIIDETYDTIESNYVRWTHAFHQLEWLAKQSQEEILHRIKPIVEHNFELIVDNKWNYNSPLRSFMKTIINLKMVD